MLEQYFYCTGFAALLLLIGMCWHAVVGDSLESLSAEQIARLRELANKYPSVGRMVMKWTARKKTLRLHHLKKAEEEAEYQERRTQRQREHLAVSEQMSLLAAVESVPASILDFPKNPSGRQ